MLGILCLSFFCCGNPSIVKRGEGEDFALTNVNDLCRLSTYKYCVDDGDIWDYYSVEYSATAIVLTVNSTFNGFIYIPNELTEVREVNVSGKMAHAQGIYYVRESYLGLTSEHIINTNNGVYAYCLSGSSIIASFLEEELSDGWQISYKQNLSFDDDVYQALNIIEHFYDKEVLYLLGVDGAYLYDNGVYTLDKSNPATIIPKLKYCVDFDIYGRDLHTFATWEITNYSATVDITNPITPKVEYDVKIYFPTLDSSIFYKGELKYSKINNIVLDIPAEVYEAWAEITV